jgi:hypothetical protein
MLSTRRLLGAIVLLAATWTHDARADERWNFELVPFVWTSALDGQQRIGDLSADVDASFGDVLDLANIGGSLRFSAHHLPWSIFGEVSYLELEQDGIGPAGNIELGVTQTLAEAGLGFWLSDHFQVYGGARYQDVDSEIRSGTGGAGHGESWVDGVLGVQLAPVASDHWLLWIRGDAGTGGSDLVWLAEAGAAYSWKDPYAVYFAYRILDTDYQKDDFEYDMRQSGFLFGFGFRF